MSGWSGTPRGMEVTLADIEASMRNAQPGAKHGRQPEPVARPSLVEFCDDLDCEGHPPPHCPDPTCCPDPDPEGEEG